LVFSSLFFRILTRFLQGDSGGPLVNAEMDTLLGIVSFAPGVHCTANETPIYYGKITEDLFHWINGKVASSKMNEVYN
jgi:secreted trypsin-like serine protease